jgi:hypothetical protein
MRCENCGREMDNAQLWKLSADPQAPSAWSMRVLCWECRAHPESQTTAAATSETATDTKSEAEGDSSREAATVPDDAQSEMGAN